MKKVDFPTFVNPTIPIFKEIPNLLMIRGGFIYHLSFVGNCAGQVMTQGPRGSSTWVLLAVGGEEKEGECRNGKRGCGGS